MNKSKIVLIIILFLLLAGNFSLLFRYLTAKKELREIKNRPLEASKINEPVLSFTKFFIEKVLKAEKEVDFETRLELESSVRKLDDEGILVQWQKFVDSKTEAEAQQEVKNLLELLVNKIKAD